MVPSGLLGLSGAGAYFLMQPFDPTPIFGFDQLLVYGVGTLAAGLLGVALGPVMGNTAFRAMHHRARPLVDQVSFSSAQSHHLKALVLLTFFSTPLS